jgi:FdrA protein
MIDNALRLDALVAAAADPAVGVVLLDVILGHGVHPDPAGVVAPAICQARARRDLKVLVHLLGTDLDPQPLASQADTLRQAGAQLYPSSAAAAEAARALATGA